MSAVIIVVTLQNLTINDFTFGEPRIGPVAEVVLLVIMLSTWLLQSRARRGKDGEELEQMRMRHWTRTHHLVIILTTVVSVVNAVSLVALLRQLVYGSIESGLTILLDAMNIWATNVIVFTLWYWMLDVGGSLTLGVREARRSEFIFAQMTAPPEEGAEVRPPSFVDYLFLSFTTSTAFSPTDTLPLTPRMKLLMMLQATVSLVTLALVAARAVNLIGS